MEYLRNLMGSVDTAASFLVYVLIALLFVFGLVKCILPVARTRSTLRGAIRTIKNGDAKKSWQEETFLGKGALFSHWSEYLNNLFFADGVYHNASSVEDYINEETVIYGPGNAGFADALPGLMVSLGFLGTLVGLAVGLSGFGMGDEAAIMSSIETLIPGMRYAFTTSIVGVIGSVSFTLISRMVNGSAQRALTGFYGAMSRYAGVLSVDPMTQIAIYQQEQTAMISTMTKDLNGRFTQRMSDAIVEAMKPVNDSLNRFVTVNTQEQMRFLDTVVTRFVTHMDQALQGQFDNLAQAMSRTAQQQEQMLSAMNGYARGITDGAAQLEKMQKLAAGMLEKLDSYVSRLSIAQRQSDEAYDKLSSNYEQMQLISRQQADYLREVSAMQNAVTDALSQLKDMVSGMNRAAQAMGDAGAKAEAFRGEMDQAARNSTQTLSRAHEEALAAFDRELQETSRALSETMDAYAARVDQTTGEIGAAVDRLPRVLQDISEQLTDQIDRMNASLNRVQRAMDDAVDRMYGK